MAARLIFLARYLAVAQFLSTSPNSGAVTFYSPMRHIVLDIQIVNGGPTGEMTAEHAARYIAKYATKSADDFGMGDRRITLETLPHLDLADHVDRLVRAAWQFGEHPAYAGLRRWVHMIGFRGHFASKSRRYSTTLGAIRGEHCSYRQRQAVEHARTASRGPGHHAGRHPL